MPNYVNIAFHANKHEIVLCWSELTCLWPGNKHLRGEFVKMFHEVIHHQTSVTSVTFVRQKASKYHPTLRIGAILCKVYTWSCDAIFTRGYIQNGEIPPLVANVNEELSRPLGGNETVYLLQTQPMFTVELAKTFDVAVPAPVEADRSICASLED